MSRFNNLGVLVNPVWASGFQFFPESCVQDRDGNFYVGEVSPLGSPNTPNRLRKFNINGQQLAAFNPEKDLRGIDWINLASDNCTIYYTSESNRIMRFNVCTNTQINGVNNPWVQGLDGVTGVCYALRIRPNAEVMVACQNNVYRLDVNGNILKIYPKPLDRTGRLPDVRHEPRPHSGSHHPGDVLLDSHLQQRAHLQDQHQHRRHRQSVCRPRHRFATLDVRPGDLWGVARGGDTDDTPTSTATQTATSTSDSGGRYRHCYRDPHGRRADRYRDADPLCQRSLFGDQHPYHYVYPDQDRHGDAHGDHHADPHERQ